MIEWSANHQIVHWWKKNTNKWRSKGKLCWHGREFLIPCTLQRSLFLDLCSVHGIRNSRPCQHTFWSSLVCVLFSPMNYLMISWPLDPYSPFLNRRFLILSYIYICDRISENGSKSHMKSIVFLHIFNCISTNAYVFPEYLLHNLDNLSIKFHVMIWNDVENAILFMLQ